MTNDIKISVIIPTYNRLSSLMNAIISVKEQNFTNYEIIVVDNACSEDTKLFIEEQMRNVNTNKFLIRYLQESKMGLHNARHAGAREARGEILIYLDDDLIADRNYLSEIYRVFKENSEAGWVGGKILPKWEIEPPVWIKYLPPSYLSLYDEGNKIKEVQWIYGHIEKKLFFELGGFNPDAFADSKMWWYRGDGEIGLLKKVRKFGKKIIYNPKAIVWHYIPKERLKVEYFQERAFKSGIEAGFSDYRYSHILIFCLKFPFYISIYALMHVLCIILSYIPWEVSIKFKVQASYYKARFLYEVKLALNRQLQKFVKTKTWLK